MLKKSDMIWKSYMFNLKKGTLKFLLHSCLDNLPTQTNLLQWENLHQISVYRQALNIKVEDKKIQIIF